MHHFLRSTCYFLAFFAFSASLNAQNFQPLTEIETELGQQAQAFSFQDAEGVTLLFQERGQARIFLLDPNMKLRQSFVLNNLPQRSSLRPLGFTNRTDALHFYYLDLETGVYEAFSVSKQDGRSEQYRLNLRERRAHLHAGAFTYQGTLHIVRMPKGSNVIRLCKFEDGGDFDTREIVLQREDFAQKVDYQLTTIHPDSTIELAHTWQNAKMYQYGPYLYLSLDEAGRTYLAEIDLTSGRQSERSLAAPSLGPDPLHYKANSLLWQDILIQFATSEDSLKIQLRDLRSGAVMSQYAYGRDQKIDIMQGQILYQSAEGANQTVKNTSEFLSYCADAPKLAVAAKSLPDSLLIFVAGAVRPVQERGLSGIVLSESYETVWFETQLDLISLAPALPIASSPRWARAQEKRPQQIQFDWQKQNYVGYYDRKRGKFVIGRE